MSQFNYYQVEGGEEVWKIVPVADVDKLPKHMFRTILSIDTPPTDSSTKEAIAGIKYSGPLYFDLDDAASPASTAKHMLALIEKLVSKDVNEDCLEVFASGGKGFHLLLDQRVFIDKPAKGYPNLATIYKEMAYELSVPSMDFRVYSGRKGRMLRCPNVLRPNSLYKVQITVAELRHLTTLGKEDAEDYYKRLCAAPRDLHKVKTEPRAFGLQALFETCKKKVEGAARKVAKQKPVELPDELPSFEAMLRGEGIKADTGFHQIALQVSITAHARNMSAEELVEAAQGLIANHESDGSRYDSPDKRRRELIRMWDYTEDNPCYSYSPGAIRALLTHMAPDLAGLEATKEEIDEGIAGSDGKEGEEFDHAGVMLTTAGFSVPVEGGLKKVLALNFAEPTEMISAASGKSTLLQSRIVGVGGRDMGIHSLEFDAFNSASALNKMVMPFGQIFAGSDAQARGAFLRLIEKARKGGRRVYVLNREGVDLVKMPFHSEEDVKQGVLVYADRQSVLTSDRAEGYEDFNLKFAGFPNPLGIFQSDMSLSPRLLDIAQEEDTIEELRKTLWHTLHTQSASYVGKLLGWFTACHYRMLFHDVYSQFPLLHVTGAAGAGKTSMLKLFANLHYYIAEPKMITPSSTIFAVKEAVAASASIPLIVDEYKPHEMRPGMHDQYKLMFRDAYNCREVSRGGGSRESTDFKVLQVAQLSAPICFVAEAAESEPAVMERVVLLTLVKPSILQEQTYFKHFDAARAKRQYLGVLGAFLAKSMVNKYTPENLREEFDPIYSQARRELMLQAGEEETLDFAERKSKSSTKERTVFNYAVLRFGLMKVSKVINAMFDKDKDLERKQEVKALLEEMYEQATSSVMELQTQTVPEWLKVFNTFSIMAQADPYSAHYLRKGRHFVMTQNANGPMFEISARECYTKYRMFCAATHDKPLFPSEQAFIHAISNLPIKYEASASLNGGIGVLAFDLEALRLQGFIEPTDYKG